MPQIQDGFVNVDTYCYVTLEDLDKINILSLPSDKKKKTETFDHVKLKRRAQLRSTNYPYLETIG